MFASAAMKAKGRYTDLELEGNDRLRSFKGFMEGHLSAIITAMKTPDGGEAWRLTIDQLAYFLIERRFHFDDIPYTTRAIVPIMEFNFYNQAQLPAEIVPMVLQRVKEVDEGAQRDSTVLHDDEVVLRKWFLKENPADLMGPS